VILSRPQAARTGSCSLRQRGTSREFALAGRALDVRRIFALSCELNTEFLAVDKQRENTAPVEENLKTASSNPTITWAAFCKRLWREYLKTVVPWARDQIFWAALMVVCPGLAALVIRKVHVDWPLLFTSTCLYAMAFGLYALFHIARAPWKIQQADDTKRSAELTQCRSAFEAQLKTERDAINVTLADKDAAIKQLNKEIAGKNAEIEEMKTIPWVGTPSLNGIFIGHVDLPDFKPTVTMSFPRRVVLNVDNHRNVTFEAGIQEVARELADHQWLKNNGAVRHPSSDQSSHVLLDLTMSNTGLVPTTVSKLELSIEVSGQVHTGQFLPDTKCIYIEKELIVEVTGSRRRVEKPSIDLEITNQNPLTRALPRTCWAHFLFTDLPSKDYEKALIRLSFRDGAGTPTSCTYLRDIVRTTIRTDFLAFAGEPPVERYQDRYRR
jgi:hypothetical protein